MNNLEYPNEAKGYYDVISSLATASTDHVHHVHTYNFKTDPNGLLTPKLSSMSQKINVIYSIVYILSNDANSNHKHA